MIKELNDLVHFVKTSVWRDSELLTFLSGGDAAALRLYQAIWSENLLTDDAAAKASGTGLTTYKKQARQLRKHLRAMTVFFSDEKAKADATVKNYLEGTLEIALLNLLHARGYRHAPLEIAKRLYRRGLDYEVPAFVTEALRILKESVLSVEGNEQLFDDYSGQYWEYRAFADAEERAADCFQWIKLPYLRKKSAHGAWKERTGQRLEILDRYKWKTPSYMFHVYYYTIRGNFLMESLDYEGALSCYAEAITYFSAKKYPVINTLAMFHYSKIPACILLGRYAEGETAVLTSLDFAPDGSFNFFNACEMYFYLTMYSGKYDQALDIYQTATLNKRFGNLREPQREGWIIFGAYLFIVYQVHKRPWPAKNLPVFKSYRFANQTQTFNRDKDGMNVAILVAHALLQLIEGKTDEMLERIQALEKYRERYLRDTDSDRSELFIKILTALPKVNFDPDLFSKKAAPALHKLSTLPRQLTKPAHELEIVPFEILTELIEGWLKQQVRSRREAVPARPPRLE